MIRKALPHEIEKIIEITRACTAYMISQQIFQWNDSYPNSKAFENDLLRDELYVLINTTSQKIIGSITVSTMKDAVYEEVAWLTKDATNFYIHRLAVHPQYQHQGNAKKLMDFAEDFAKQKKANSIRLDTFSLNTRNVSFYENRGYKRLESIYFPKQSEAPFYCYELVL